MPGPTPNEPDVIIIPEYKNFGAPSDRLVSGFVIVNVRNMHTRDINQEYSRFWSMDNVAPSTHTHSPNAVSGGNGIAPFYYDGGWNHPTRSKPPAFPTKEIFENGLRYGDTLGNTAPYREFDISFPTLNQEYNGTDYAEQAGETVYKWGHPGPRWAFPKIEGRKYDQINSNLVGGSKQITELDWSGTAAVTGADPAWFGHDGTGAGGAGAKVGRCFYFYAKDWQTRKTDGAITGGSKKIYNNGRYKVWFRDTYGTDSTEPNPVDSDFIQSLRVSYNSSSATVNDVLNELIDALELLEADGSILDPSPGVVFESVSPLASNKFTCTDKHNAFRGKYDFAPFPSTIVANSTATGVDVNLPIWEAVGPSGAHVRYGTCTGLVFKETIGSLVGWNYGTGEELGGDPDESATAVRYDKELALGDYDCYLFYVVCGAHIDDGDYGAPSLGAIPWTPNGSDKFYHHDKCQSFIKSHLISRINCAADTNAFILADEIGMGYNPSTGTGVANNLGGTNYKQGEKVVEYTISDLDIGFAQDGHTNQEQDEEGEINRSPLNEERKWIMNQGIYNHVLNGEEYWNRFGINLAAQHDGTFNAFPHSSLSALISKGSNNFQTPVHSISIGIGHDVGTGFYKTGSGHPLTYTLRVKVKMYSYLLGDGTGSGGHEYTQNNCNILWMPWGETAKIFDP